jgi:hypothetical protein
MVDRAKRWYRERRSSQARVDRNHMLLRLESTSRILLAACGLALAAASPAAADGWLPHPADATWTYQWTDSVYDTTPTTEKVTVKDTKGTNYQLAWTTVDQGNDPAAPTSVGVVYLSDTDGGIVNVDPGWASNAAPPGFPILCSALAQCGNSLASTWYQLIWGTRAPLLTEPLLTGTTWSTSGGAANDVSSSSDYVGTESITVSNSIKTVVVASNGTWSTTVWLGVGTHTLTATQSPAAGLESAPSGSRVVTVVWG